TGLLLQPILLRPKQKQALYGQVLLWLKKLAMNSCHKSTLAWGPHPVGAVFKMHHGPQSLRALSMQENYNGLPSFLYVSFTSVQTNAYSEVHGKSSPMFLFVISNAWR